MIKIKSRFACLFLILSIISVLLTAIIPLKNIAIGQVFIQSYNGIYSAAALCIFLFCFFGISKQIKEDIWVNRLKFLLSCTFLISLVSNIIFL